MNTLDEVIDYCEGKQTCGEWVGIGDALHYLKAYRILQIAYIYVKAMTDLEDNPPLTWDELKQMEGKPVWVEWKNDKEWMLNLGAIYVLDGSLRMSLRSLRGWHSFTEQEMKDGTWQAYRKEQE